MRLSVVMILLWALHMCSVSPFSLTPWKQGPSEGQPSIYPSPSYSSQPSKVEYDSPSLLDQFSGEKLLKLLELLDENTNTHSWNEERGPQGQDFLDDLIQLQKGRYLELLDTTLENNLQENFALIMETDSKLPQIERSCLQKILSSDILEQCIYQYHSLPDSFKSEVAAKLAICQLESNGVAYPRECHSLRFSHENENDNNGSEESRGGYIECIEKLFETPQHWTTFDASYKLVNYGCLQESSKYESSKFIELQLNITQYQKNLHKILTENLSTYQHLKDTVLQKVEKDIDSKIAALYTGFLQRVEKDREEHLSRAVQVQASQLEKFSQVWQSSVKLGKEEVNEFVLWLKMEMYNQFELNKMFLNDSVSQIRNILDSQLANLANSTVEITLKLNGSLSQVLLLEKKVDRVASFLNVFQNYSPLEIGKKVARGARISLDHLVQIANYFNYFLFILSLVYGSVRYVYNYFNKGVKATFGSVAGSKAAGKLVKILAFNAVGFLIGRSLVYCFEDLRARAHLF